MLKNYIRALRLPFLAASILPFFFGSFLAIKKLSGTTLSFGLFSVIFTHLGANLINDYADSKSGVDWQDKRFYKFFGGSKLIQKGIFSEKFYLKASIICFSLATFSLLGLSILLQSISIWGFYFLILFLGFSYSHRPLCLSYRMLGELTIFFLFGPALVMGGYFIQTKIFPTLEGLMTSLPFGFFTVAVLFVNEVPDCRDDLKAGKNNLLNLGGPEKAYIFYLLLTFLGFLTIVINILLGYLSSLAFLALVFILPVFKSANILKRYFKVKLRLLDSSKWTIVTQGAVSLILILSLIFRFK